MEDYGKDHSVKLLYLILIFLDTILILIYEFKITGKI